MARPRTPIGTYGRIKVTLITEKTKSHPAVYEARARFRMPTGRYARPRRRGPSETQATNALKEHMTQLANDVTSKRISASTRVTVVVDRWLAAVERKVELGTLAPKTLYDYRDTARNHIKPGLGELTCSELEVSVGTCDELIKSVQDKVGFAAAQRTKVVLSGICGFAIRHGAMTINPARQVEALSRAERKKVRALEPKQRGDFLAKLRNWVKEKTSEKGEKYSLGPRARAWLDLPDIAEGQLSTGGRLGEVLAITGDDVDPVKRTVVVNHHLVRIKGQGIVRVPLRKGGNEGLTLKVPRWSVPMWRRRKLESGGGPLFPAWNGEWVDPSNVTKRFRTACDAIGYHWVASHTFRRTTGTHLDEQGASNNEIADRLGNTPDVVERSYRAKRVADPATADMLESLFDVVEDEDPDEEATG